MLLMNIHDAKGYSYKAKAYRTAPVLVESEMIPLYTNVHLFFPFVTSRISSHVDHEALMRELQWPLRLNAHAPLTLCAKVIKTGGNMISGSRREVANHNITHYSTPYTFIPE